IVHPSKPGVCRRRNARAPFSTRGSISKSSSQTARSRRCLGRRVLNRSVGSRMWPSAETTRPLLSVIRDPLSAVFPAALVYRRIVNQPVGTDEGDGVAKRRTPRPDGSTWGDWGDDAAL